MSKADAYLHLSSILDPNSRNLLRGILGQKNYKVFTLYDVNRVRTVLSPRDLVKAANFLMGEKGAFPFKNITPRYAGISSLHGLHPAHAGQDAAFVVGRLNGWREAVVQILQDISLLARKDADKLHINLRSIEIFYEKWGVSDFLNKKLAFVMDTTPFHQATIEAFRDLATKMGLNSAPTPYFAATEAVSERFPYFEVISSWVNALDKDPDATFRQQLPLHNVLPTPVTLADISPFLRKCHSMSLVDEIVAIKLLLSLADNWPELAAEVTATLDPGILDAYDGMDREAISPGDLILDSKPIEADFNLYRRSAAFLEFRELARYRNKTDRLLAHRLLPKHFASLAPRDGNKDWKKERRSLSTALLGYIDEKHSMNGQNVGTFLRTVNFLQYLTDHRNHIDFDEHELRTIFENTTSLQILLTDDELDRLYYLASSDAKLIISTLALALYKERNSDEDIDFIFRHYLQQAIITRFAGDVLKFIEWLSPSTPSVASFITKTLDRNTIQKLYLIVDSAEQADSIRQSILRHMGEKLGIIEYFVEADRIKAHNQVSKMKSYIDDSRIFVDAIALKKWFKENPNGYLQEYIRLVEHSFESVERNAILIREDGSVTKFKAAMSVVVSFDYMLMKAFLTTFQQFCLNHHFGIESYLGRRIRHNTLHGMMLGGVDSIIDKPHYRSLSINGEFYDKYTRWLSTYKALIEKIRTDLLQFRSDKQRLGLFSSELDEKSPDTKKNLIELRNFLLKTNISDLFEDAVMRFCWAQIEPQLANAQKYLTVDLVTIATSKIDEIFGSPIDNKERQFKTEIRDSVHERFLRLGSWFRVPDNSFASASIREIGDLILVECESAFGRSDLKIVWSGNGTDVPLHGSSVHRMYDCLFVLIHNAFRHGEATEDVSITVLLSSGPQSILATVEVEVASVLPDEQDALHHIDRIGAVLSDTQNLSLAMVKEGYSGIRKIMYLTKQNEGVSTVKCRSESNTVCVAFSGTVEIGGMAGSAGVAS